MDQLANKYNTVGRGHFGADENNSAYSAILERYGINTKATDAEAAEAAPAGPAHTQYPTEPYPAVVPDNTKAINDMFDANINAQKIALQESGDQALSDAQANRDNIAKIYQQQKNASAVDWERQRRNFLEGANTSGINTGAGSQAELSMMGMQQRSQNALGAAQAGAEVEADRNIADIRRNTQAAINQAIAENDYKKAAALLDDYNLQYNRAMARAQDLAAFGDFSGYAAIYGEQQANSMWTSWVAQNPQVAYMMGQITADQYANLKAGLPINENLDVNGVRIPGTTTPNSLYGVGANVRGGFGGGGGDDPWAYGGSGWNYGSSDGSDNWNHIANLYNDRGDEIIDGITDRLNSVTSAALGK